LVTDQLIYLITAAAMVFLGLGSMSYSRNLVKTIMAFQVMVFGVNLGLFASELGGAFRPLADSLVFFSIIVGASVEAVGLALVVAIYRKYGTLNPSEIRRLRH
jgi:NADH:ubiquinone oxidoreductase subunit K